MMTVEDYFLKFTDQLAYLDLKDEVANAWDIHVPMPIRTRDFTQGLRKGELEERIDSRYFAYGMIWNLGIDPAFLHASRYREILQKMAKNPAGLAMQLGLQALHQEDTESAGIAFRAATVLDPNNPAAKLYYGNLLLSVSDLDEESRLLFRREGSKLLEEALALDEKNPFILASLAQLSEREENYKKAVSYYQLALEEAPNDVFADQIRTAMEGIGEEADLEDAIYYMRRADYGKALDLLTALLSRAHRWDAEYYIGICHQNLGNYEEAVDFLKRCMEDGGDLEDAYNGLVFNLAAAGEPEEAIAYANRGLQVHPAALRLRFNRALLLHQAGENEKALEDLDALLSYQDLSDEFFNQIMTLREHLLQDHH